MLNGGASAWDSQHLSFQKFLNRQRLTIFLPLCGLLGGASPGHHTWHEAKQSHFGKISIATWNLDSIKTTADQAFALDFDICGLQELRVDANTASGIGARAKLAGYQLMTGALPVNEHHGKHCALQRHIPGVGFIIRDSISARTSNVPSLQKWEDKGRILAIQVFLAQRWIEFLSIYAPVDDPEPMLMDLLQYLESNQHRDICVLGDFNQDTREGNIVFQLQQLSFLPLTMLTNYDFHTFRRSNTTSCIDSIVVSSSIAEHCSPVQQWNAPKLGHNIIFASLYFTFEIIPSWEPLPPLPVTNKCEVSFEPLVEQWTQLVHEFSQDSVQTTVQQDWEKWAITLQKCLHTTNENLGIKPSFRMRDSFSNRQACSCCGAWQCSRC